MKRFSDRKNYIRNKKNIDRICVEIKEESKKREFERKEKNKEKYGGHGLLIVEGKNDRINKIKPKSFEDASMEKSYLYGYYQYGSLLLEGTFVKEEYTPEEQMEFGMMDVINEIPEKYIRGLKKYPQYMNGRLYQLGKNACDFIIAEGITIEDYTKLVSIVSPEVTSETFIKGYNDRLNEYENKKTK